ncbi:7472_t:CDS:2 [Ambispora gerdemannii]|uniref:7472_t:CDS:1 n=1 Tax=Ambispora gerdemannii TaxID=144530 RepID=A0A9N9GID8_9GLOM|nr:7472_t:CDS:2 [Ambispora gerdemannii]
MSIYPFDDNTYNQFGDIWRYWNYAGASTNELGFVACRLYGICFNAAAVERLWSCMSFLQTDRRNQLMLSSPGFLEENAKDQMDINSEENQEIQENEENEESGEIEAEPEEIIDLILDEDFDDDESPDSSSLEADFGQFLDV